MAIAEVQTLRLEMGFICVLSSSGEKPNTGTFLMVAIRTSVPGQTSVSSKRCSSPKVFRAFLTHF